MQKLYVTAALLLMASLTAHAQADFQPGYIVRPAGDTLRGEIDYRDAYANAKQCRFRPSATAPITVFGPTELRAYYLQTDRRLYQALTPPAAAPSAGATAPATPAEPPTAYFMQALVSGPASLYFLRGALRTDQYYVATAAFPLTELTRSRVRIEQEGKFYMQDNNTYRTTLARALPGCPVVQAQLPALAFSEQALTRIVGAYNACLNPQPVAVAAATVVAPARQHARLGLLLGIKRTSLTFDNGGSTQSIFSKNLDFDADVKPVVGLALNLPLGQFSRKLSLEMELYYEAEKYAKSFDTNYIVASAVVNSFTLDLAYLRLPVLVRYTFPKGTVRPLVEVGPTFAYALKTTNTAYSSTGTGAARNERVYFDDNGGFRRFETGVSAGVGGQFATWQGRQATLLARYEYSNGFSGFTGLSTPTQRAYVLLTADLFK